jgi:hypothetical protein
MAERVLVVSLYQGKEQVLMSTTTNTVLGGMPAPILA